MSNRTFYPVAADAPHFLKPYSFRAEGARDVLAFLNKVYTDAVATDRFVSALFIETDIGPNCGTHECVVEFQSNISLEELRAHLRTIEDSHVMLQTLRQLPLYLNNCERDFTL
jgi:hypothetical protein